MNDWFRAAIILGVVMLLITANVIEFRAKRRADADAVAAIDGSEPRERLLVQQYRQTQNIEQLLHVIATLLFSILVALLWV
jgi:hypothetical protein